jgi:hypothetical protein
MCTQQATDVESSTCSSSSCSTSCCYIGAAVKLPKATARLSAAAGNEIPADEHVSQGTTTVTSTRAKSQCVSDQRSRPAAASTEPPHAGGAGPELEVGGEWQCGHRRGAHLSRFASGGGRGARSNAPAMLPPDKKIRLQNYGKATCVVLMLAHSGVSQPLVWEQLVANGNEHIAMLIHVEGPRDALCQMLRRFRWAEGHGTAWGDFSLFGLVVAMLRSALKLYPEAKSFVTVSGDSVPCAPADAFRDIGGWCGATTVLGLQVVGVGNSGPEPEPFPTQAFEHSLPALDRENNYGSTWIVLSQQHAKQMLHTLDNTVATTGATLVDTLRHFFRTTCSEGCGCNLFCLPDEEFVSYVLISVASTLDETARGQRAMEAVMVESTKPDCKHTIARAAALTMGSGGAYDLELAMRRGYAHRALCVRKVSADVSSAKLIELQERIFKTDNPVDGYAVRKVFERETKKGRFVREWWQGTLAAQADLPGMYTFMCTDDKTATHVNFPDWDLEFL